MTIEPQPQERSIGANREYEEALDTLFAQPGRVVRIFDRSLTGNYNSSRRHELLRKFLLATRSARIHIVVHDASNIARDCPRMINLLRDFGHAISINETRAEAKGVYDPFCVMDERHYLHRFHFEQPRGVLALDEPQGAHGFVKRFCEIWEASAPALSATTLGL